MRHALAASLLLACLTAAAQEPSPPRERGHWHLGLSVGTGSVTTSHWSRSSGTPAGDWTQVTDNGPGSLHLRAGVALTQRLLLGVELTGVGWRSPDSRFADASLLLTWYPAGPGPFLRAGLGAASVRADGRRSGLSHRLGGGYGFRLGRSWELCGAVDYLALPVRGTPMSGASGRDRGAGALLLSMGLDWI